MFSKPGLIISPIKRAISPVRGFSTLSSDLVWKEEHLETHWRGKLLKFDYSELRDNPACQEIHYGSYYDEGIMSTPGPDALPELGIRRNDMIDIDWDDGTSSSLCLTKLIEQRIDAGCTKSAKIMPKPTLVDPELECILRELSESGYSRAECELDEILPRVAFFSEASNYVQTYKNVSDALPSDHNGLAILQCNEELTLQLVNGKKYCEAFKTKHPKYFKKLATQPSLVYPKSYPSKGFLKCITLNENNQSEVEEIRLGAIDPVSAGDYVQKAYNTFESEMQADDSSDEEDYLEEVILTPDSVVLIDCTMIRYGGEPDENSEDLKVQSCLLTNDNWKSTARMLKTQM